VAQLDTAHRDIPAEVAKLKAAEPADDLHIMGSGALIRSLSAHGLIDEYLLSVHPIVLAADAGSLTTVSRRPRSISPARRPPPPA